MEEVGDLLYFKHLFKTPPSHLRLEDLVICLCNYGLLDLEWLVVSFDCCLMSIHRFTKVGMVENFQLDL